MPQIFSGKTDFIKVLSDDKQKVYTFEFPVGTSLGEAYDILTHLRGELWKKLEENKKEEDAKKKDNQCDSKDDSQCDSKDECKADLQDKKNSKKDLNEVLLGKDKK